MKSNVSKFLLLSALTLSVVSFSSVKAYRNSVQGSDKPSKRMKQEKSWWRSEPSKESRESDAKKLEMLEEKLNKLAAAQEKKEAMIQKAKVRINVLKQKWDKATPEQKAVMKEKFMNAKERIKELYKRLGVIEHKKEWVEAYVNAKKQQKTVPARKRTATPIRRLAVQADEMDTYGF